MLAISLNYFKLNKVKKASKIISRHVLTLNSHKPDTSITAAMS